ncbi:hypothetical protein ACFSQJ_11540 [Croceitalea marina]|uniref:Uncharacterized protein n=1 Tax=Croceitalea marina TaxID=1775166 RepID=A0ABW5MWQ5_9FLAO
MDNHKPYNENLGHPHDFLVEYQILTESENGRKTLPYQGIRWDFWYEHKEHEENHLFMIWPEFIDESGNVIKQKDKPVPRVGKAKMWIVNDKMRKYHQGKIKIGMKCYGREGARTVVNYEVIEIVGLMTNPASE